MIRLVRRNESKLVMILVTAVTRRNNDPPVPHFDGMAEL